ncbi:sensor histidine kinase [Spirosoma foliorum]|uniref:histidine kinase n=1 Tax=Spirosoma foliorum TaxID=2710596 RepID=A0A7G5H6L3_9BACT|nr:7TM diverse intracellular signaling domain-containing protein [Spirosoma foliorum]QMW06755.1 hypothetical protein H3H32_18615 [Spirosoma foliorum]
MKPLLSTYFLFLFVNTIQAQSVVLNNPNQTYLIFENCAALPIEPGQKITLDSLLHHPDTYRFSTLKQRPFQSDNKHSYWFKVDLINPTLDNYFLRCYYASDLVQVYEIANNQLIDSCQIDFHGTSNQDLFQRSRSILPLQLRQGQTRTLYFFVPNMSIPDLHIGIMSAQRLTKEIHFQDLLNGLFYGFIFIIVIYSLLLGIRLGDRDNILYALSTVVTTSIGISSNGTLLELPGNWVIALKDNHGVHTGISVLFQIGFILSFLQLRQRAPWLYRGGVALAVVVAIATAGVFSMYLLRQQQGHHLQDYLGITTAFPLTFFGTLAGITVAIKGYRPGLFYALGSISVLICTGLFVLSLYGVFPFMFWNQNGASIGLILEIIFFLLGLTYKINQLKKKQDEAILEQLRLTQENQTLIETQNRVLEEKVEQRTAELKASQAQLIQKEKLASLGELTAGIAHEIQNPLNFVNNFSAVSTELVDELQEGPLQLLPESEKAYSDAILGDLRHNMQKINHHGNRASSIVKGMLEHSRVSNGERQLTDLNKLANDYLRLAYQNQRAKDNLFTCQLVTSFDPTIPAIQLDSQDIGRVLLNLYNNAFYAIRQWEKQQTNGYQPMLEVSSYAQNGYVALRVKDNGPGIQEPIKDKLFQPFFTTKPPGEGTGLGLSLSYDIVTKGHAGDLLVDSQEGRGATFTVQLPI